MKTKKAVLILLLIGLTVLPAYTAKYTVNTSGTVRNQSGTTITSPSNSVNQNYYNVYSAQNYVNNNQVNSNPVGIIEFVMDYSGSMSNWVEVAKHSMSAIVAQLNPDTKVGFRVFGHNYHGINPFNVANTVQEVKKIVKDGNKFKVVTEKGCLGSTSGACSATQMVSPIVTLNVNSLINGMNSVSLGGATPLVFALNQTVNQDFSTLDKFTSKKIILITDGYENCGGNPCEFASRLMKKRSDIHIDVVLVGSGGNSNLSCLADTTGGHMYNVVNLADFSNAVTQSAVSQPGTQSNTPAQSYEYVGN